jgi:hypothetical protein
MTAASAFSCFSINCSSDGLLVGGAAIGVSKKTNCGFKIFLILLYIISLSNNGTITIVNTSVENLHAGSGGYNMYHAAYGGTAVGMSLNSNYINSVGNSVSSIN